MSFPHVHLDTGKPFERRSAQAAPVGLALSLRVNLHVTLERVGLDERHPADLTPVRLDVVVDHHVLFELILLVPGRATDLTHKGPRSVGDVLAVNVPLQAARLDVPDVAVRTGKGPVVVVDLDVVAEVGAPAEGHAALRADVRLGATVVDSHVVLEVVDGLGGQAADLADVGSVRGVAALVQPEGAGGGEGFAALTALVWLDPRVLTQVHRQVVRPRVARITVRAGKRSIPTMHAQVAFQLVLGPQIPSTQFTGEDPLHFLFQRDI